jgi:hypothetical protein
MITPGIIFDPGGEQGLDDLKEMDLFLRGGKAPFLDPLPYFPPVFQAGFEAGLNLFHFRAARDPVRGDGSQQLMIILLIFGRHRRQERFKDGPW